MRISDWSSDVCSSDLYFGPAYVWRQGEAEVDRRHGLWELIDTDAYRNNPIRLVTDQGVAMRRRLTAAEASFEYELLVDLKNQGATDYVIDRKSTRLNSRH